VGKEDVMKNVWMGLLVLVLAVVPAAAFGLPSSIDGDLSDWGVGRSGGEWICDDGITYVVENSTRSRSDSGAVSQKFDAEGMGAFYSGDDGMLYVTVVTGTPPGGAVYKGDTYAPGDLAIDLNGDGAYEFGIETTGNGEFAAGTVVSAGAGDWSMSDGSGSVPISLVGGSDTGFGAGIAYGNNGGAYGRHYVIETAIPVDAFGAMWGDPFTLSWTMESGADVVSVDVPIDGDDGDDENGSPIPEPATLVLIGIGIVGAAVARKKS
jgi:hypothetical protein